MTDMELIIKIPRTIYRGISNANNAGKEDNTLLGILYKAVANGQPLPENATNGDLVKALFPNQHVSVFSDGHGHKRISVKFTETEWKAPYNADKEGET